MDRLQISHRSHGIIAQTREQFKSIPSAKKLYHTCKKVATAEEKTLCVEKCDSLSIIFRFKDAAFLEMSNHLWNLDSIQDNFRLSKELHLPLF